MVETIHSEAELSQMSKQTKKSGEKASPHTKKSKLRGWLFIAALALATAVFFVAGTVDSKLRYEWIGI